MTDPLRPFAQVIRSLWQARSRSTRAAAESAAGSQATAAETRPRRDGRTRVGETLASRLHARITSIDGGDPRKMRDAFVETVLLWEFGEQLAPDPAFGEVVSRVSEQLASDAAVDTRLRELLTRMAQQPRSVKD